MYYKRMVDQIIINGQLISYLRAGTASTGKSLLFLHGWRSQKEVWNGVVQRIKELESGRISIYALDFPGFGGSPAPKEPWTVGDYANVVKAFIDRLELKNVIVIGHSFGGRVAIKLCSIDNEPNISGADKSARYTIDVINKLVLVDSAGFVFNPDKKQMMNLIAKTVKPFFKPKFMEPVRRLIYKTIGAEDYLSTPELRQTFVNIVNEDLSESMEKINIPVLIIWGEKDIETPFEFAGMMKNKIKNSELIVFENAGHFSFLDKREEFVLELKKFIS